MSTHATIIKLIRSKLMGQPVTVEYMDSKTPAVIRTDTGMFEYHRGSIVVLTCEYKSQLYPVNIDINHIFKAY